MSISAPAPTRVRRPRSRRLPAPPTTDEIQRRPELRVFYTRLQTMVSARKLRHALQDYLKTGVASNEEHALCRELLHHLEHKLALVREETEKETSDLYARSPH